MLEENAIVENGKIKIHQEMLSNTEVNKYIIIIYIDEEMAGNDVISATFKGSVSAEAYQGKILNPGEKTLSKLNLSLSDGTPDLNKTSEEDNTNGIYSAEDDFGVSYYFRGNVTNNYVKFGKYPDTAEDSLKGKDMYRRIIRINGDGTIRMIYAGTSAHPNGYDDSTTKDTSIGTSRYNPGGSDEKYFGYIYSSGQGTEYDSEVKEMIDTWYSNNLSKYSTYIYDAIYCNDINSLTAESGASRFSFSDLKPTFICTSQDDRYTQNLTTGNGKLTYPIGLITLDEVIYAGAIAASNQTFYLYTGYNIVTSTPMSYQMGSGGTQIGTLSGLGGIFSDATNTTTEVRPVITIKPESITGGAGTQSTSFTVE